MGRRLVGEVICADSLWIGVARMSAVLKVAAKRMNRSDEVAVGFESGSNKVNSITTSPSRPSSNVKGPVAASGWVSR